MKSDVDVRPLTAQVTVNPSAADAVVWSTEKAVTFVGSSGIDVFPFPGFGDKPPLVFRLGIRVLDWRGLRPLLETFAAAVCGSCVWPSSMALAADVETPLVHPPRTLVPPPIRRATNNARLPLRRAGAPRNSVVFMIYPPLGLTCLGPDNQDGCDGL